MTTADVDNGGMTTVRTKAMPTKTPRRGLARLAEVLDHLNRIYGVIPVPTKKDSEDERSKK